MKNGSNVQNGGNGNGENWKNGEKKYCCVCNMLIPSAAETVEIGRGTAEKSCLNKQLGQLKVPTETAVKTVLYDNK